MIFSSTTFIFIFLPLVILIYFLLRPKLQNIWLLLASLFFYSWGEPRWILIMLLSIGVNYVIGLFIDKFQSKKPSLAKFGLMAAVLFNIGLLVFFKYSDFIVANLNSILELSGSSFSWALPQIKLPIGISFFTFQILSYVIDLFRKQIKVQKNIFNLALYISFFPQLIAGPIVRYIDIEKQLTNRRVTSVLFADGVKRFIFGFCKKILIADQMAILADIAFDASGYTFALSWIGVLAFGLQLYFDFSGYSDMAIGMGKMFGFHFPENFNFPYISRSIREFWRRWHISLSSWFKDYVYIPLGGNRRGQARTYLNLIIVFFLTGLWHGASWNFVVWGLFHGLFLILERLFLGKLLDKLPGFIRWLYAILVVGIGWVFFRADNLSLAVKYIKALFDFGSPSVKFALSFLTPELIVFTILGIVLSLPILSFLRQKLQRLLNSNSSNRFSLTILQPAFKFVSYIGVMLLFVLGIWYLVGRDVSPFIYFRF